MMRSWLWPLAPLAQSHVKTHSPPWQEELWAGGLGTGFLSSLFANGEGQAEEATAGA